MSTIQFIKNFIKDKDVASITPTSIRCVKKVCKHIDFDQDLLIVEYGPGDGVFSRYLLDHMTPGSKLVMVEANEDFARHLEQSIEDPRSHVVNGLAGDVMEMLEESDIGRVDYVISGIPFSFIDPDRKQQILQATKTILRPGGKFLAYQTSGHLKKPVMDVFGNFTTEFEILNIPPYFIYEVVKNGS